MNLTVAMKKNLAKLSKDEYRIIPLWTAPTSERKLIESGYIVEGPTAENKYGVMSKTYKIVG